MTRSAVRQGPAASAGGSKDRVDGSNATAAAAGPPHRELLFLQGMPGPFFRRLADTLVCQGHEVHRVNFNGGDLLSWGLSGLNYRGSQRDWAPFIARLLIDRRITDVVMFGDCRPLHRVAKATAMGLGVAVHVFEEGYIRPDWITLERGGVNGFSALPNDPLWYRAVAAQLAPLEPRLALPEAFARRALASVAYYAAAILLAWLFPHGRSHRPWHPLLEAAGWLGRLSRRKSEVVRSRAQAARLHQAPFFILPLQLDSDYQLRTHSDFDGMQPAVACALASFARHAPAGVNLVIKAHPLDNGLSGWRRRTMAYARAVGIADRVLFLEVGDIGVLVRAALGVVTVNSTTGTLALEAGVPVLTLGRAVYDLPGLTHQGPLDMFWTEPERPCLDLYDAFRRVLGHTCLLHGGFYDASCREALLAAASGRILAPAQCLHPQISSVEPKPSNLERPRGRRRAASAPRPVALVYTQRARPDLPSPTPSQDILTGAGS